MTNDETARLEQALRDERAERDAAQARVGDLEGKIATWRGRAEARAARIASLEAERDQLRSTSGWLRARLGRTLRRGAAHPVAETTRATRPELPHVAVAGRAGRPSMPAIRAAVAVSDPFLARIMAETDTVQIEASVPNDADVVVVDEVALRERPAVASAVDAWSSLQARVPLVVLSARPDHVDARAALVLDASDVLTFDPVSANPALRSTIDPRRAAIGTAQPEELALVTDALAIDSDGLDHGLTAGAVRRKRSAFMDRSPSVLASRMLGRAGVPATLRSERVAGLLVSMRPDDVGPAIDRFAAQEHADKELIVVCHGFPAADARHRLEQASVAGRVLEASSDVSLGACLNSAAGATAAPILAKIDDDDHYGPGYLTDAVQALSYSGADVVGKATQFTYVQSDDVTVLRRAGVEEQMTDGSVAGGSMVMRREIWHDVRFADRPRRVDALFLRGARALGARIYATSRWDFVYVRHGSDQTWRADDAVFGEHADRAWDGRHFERANA